MYICLGALNGPDVQGGAALLYAALQLQQALLQPGTKLGLGVQCIGGGAVRLAPIERHSFTGAAKPLHGREQQLHRLIGGQCCGKAGIQLLLQYGQRGVFQ